MYRIIFLLLITSASFGQVLQETNGSRAENRIVHKLGFRLPQVCWVTGNPNLLNYSAFMSKGAMVYDTCAGKIKRWSGSAWISVADSMATGDTTGLGALFIRNTTTHENKRFSVQSGRLDSILAASSAGLSFYSNSGTQVGLFGAGGGAGATFYGGVNIDGTTRLNTGLTGVLIGTSGTVSATPNKMVTTFDKNATRDSAILTLADGTRLAVRDSVGGGGGSPGGGTYSIQYNRAGAFAGRSTFVFDTVNARVGIGTASPAATLSVNSSSGNTNSGIKVTNTGTLNNAYAAIEMVNNISILSQIALTGSNWAASNGFRPSGSGWATDGAGGMSFVAYHGSSDITFNTNTAFAERLRIDQSGGVSIGSSADANSSSLLEITSTTKGFLPPRMTTAQRNAIASPASGLQMTNTSLQNHLNFYNGTAWLGTNQQVGNEAITGNKTISATTGTHLHMIDATSGNVTITLPTMAAGYVGVEYQFIRTDGSANTVTIQRAASNTINNAATSFTIAQFERAFVIGVNNSNTFTWHAGKFTNY